MPSSPANSEMIILRELLSAEQGFVSGSALAQHLGVSRVAVWQHMEKLRAQGFGFEAVRARGYRLSGRPESLNATLIEALLPARRTCDVLLLDEVDSTNDEASRQLSSGRQAPFVVLARRQSRGRGRFGRIWESERPGNLYASFGFRPELSPERMQTFTLWMGVCVCELVAAHTQSSPGLKWPNDLLFDGRKAGGMLTEARIDSDRIRELVFGLGLNVNAGAESLPPALSRRATSLSEHAAAPLDLNRFAAALISAVTEAFYAFTEGNYKDRFADLWNQNDLLRGQRIAVLQGSQRFEGTAAGVDDEGALLLRDELGGLKRFRAGEVTLEKKPL